MQTVKSTISIPAQLKEEMQRYVSLKLVSSFSGGVSTAIEAYLKELRRLEYDKMMAEAAGDKAFIERTMDCQKETEKLSGVPGEW
jgi:metal-responsive CopG/Arc/MetJ family transcriptional regulator